MRKLYSPVQIMEDTLQYPLQLTIQNNYDFRTLKGYSLHWSLQNLNRQVASGSISLEALPKAKERFEIPSNLPPNILYNDVMLCVSVIDEKELPSMSGHFLSIWEGKSINKLFFQPYPINR